VVVVVGACVVVVVVGACVVVVVVVVGGVIERPHPVALQACAPAGIQIGALLVSNRLLIASPIEAGDAAATALKVTMATLTTPVGPVRLLVWNAFNFVWQLLAAGQVVETVGVPWNAGVLPPETVATVTTVGS